MADEKKVETDTTEKKTDATKESEETKEPTEQEETKESEETEEADKEDEQEPSQDWKKIAQEHREARERAETKLNLTREKARERIKAKELKGEEETIEEEEDKPLTASQLERILAKERDMVRKEVLASETKRIARELAASDEEAEAIVEIFNGHSFPEHLSHEDKVRQAMYIAHGPHLMGKIMELRRSLKSKDTKKSGGSENTHRDAPKGSEPKLSGQDKTVVAEGGWKWDGKRYTKKMPNGKTLVKNSLKDKPSFLEG